VVKDSGAFLCTGPIGTLWWAAWARAVEGVNRHQYCAHYQGQQGQTRGFLREPGKNRNALEANNTKVCSMQSAKTFFFKHSKLTWSSALIRFAFNLAIFQENILPF